MPSENFSSDIHYNFQTSSRSITYKLNLPQYHQMEKRGGGNFAMRKKVKNHTINIEKNVLYRDAKEYQAYFYDLNSNISLEL
jgi:hemolysin activation/secretion protein